MFFFLITSFTFITLLYKSLAFKLVPTWGSEFRLISFRLWKDLSLLALIRKNTRVLDLIPLRMLPLRSKPSGCSHVETVSQMSVLDLPDLALECILEKVPPEGLCHLASVCSSLRERCMSDHLWERHLKQKWGGIIGPAAYREWQWHIALRKDSRLFNQAKQKGLVSYLSRLWPVSVIVGPNLGAGDKGNNLPPIDSVMYWYLALESGKFWFPAQVYNRENGHVGFMLSCYDAELSYDPRTDTFHARYPPHGRMAVAIETGVTWDRLRAPLVDTPAHDLHISDCLYDLRPGDHIEIQWRRNKKFPYGWWYGVVGHLETCDGNQNYCRCHECDTVVLEFNQYSPGSRWRRTSVRRKDHREEGNETDGFYGGIQKVESREVISTWKRLWPAEVLE
ncbi:F-box protein At2g32560-like [Ipomoea triloba]|uniref:F-box protein At2g32560-like n=1 Tax=Ipomoea triloba TaxID=35885 RepID=UPI00125DE2B3|nr:F-box protein At2g32560-like [Ipomoea triloba]